MINLATVQPYFKPHLKQHYNLKLKPVSKLENINIFTMPSKINDRDIKSMFNGLLTLMREKLQQEQTEKYLRLKLKYNKLKLLYHKLKLNNLSQ